MQAQSDDIEITADKNVKITACKEKVEIVAGDEILLACGGGYIRLKGGNIEIHCPGEVSVKGANHVLSGGNSLSQSFNEMPNVKFDDKYQLIDEHTGIPIKNKKYVIQREWGELEKGISDGEGYTHLVKNPDAPESIKIVVV